VKKLSETEIIENYNKFLELIELNFEGEEKEKILKMCEFFQERMMLAPASYKEHYHSAHPGGYIEHVLNVYNIAMSLKEVWNQYSDAVDYTDKEIAMVTLFHDIGKLGDENEEFYAPQDNDWRRENAGEIYKINEKLINMTGEDRSLYILQFFDIKLNINEWIAIKIHEGMYTESNAHYLKTSFKSSVIRSHLFHLIHHADVMAARIEYEQWRDSSLPKKEKKKIVLPPRPDKSDDKIEGFNLDELFS